MDIHSNDVLKQLLEKMDSHQHKLDCMRENLETLQIILQRQNEKQNLLDQILIQLAVKLHKETFVTKEHIQGTRHEVSEPFCVVADQRESPILPQKTSQSVQGWDNRINDKLKSVDFKTADTAHKCHRLTSRSLKLEEKMTELAGNSAEMVKIFLVEMRSVKDLIRGQTNSELLWLNSQIDKKLSGIGSVVSEIYQQQTKAREDIGLPTGQRVKTDMKYRKQQGDINEPFSDKPKLSMEICNNQMQVVVGVDRKIDLLSSSILCMSRDVKTSLDTILTTNKQLVIDMKQSVCHSVDKINESSKEQSLLIYKTLKSDLIKHFEAVQSNLQTNKKTVISESETQANRIISVVATAKEHLRHLIQTEGNTIKKYKVEMESMLSLINSPLNSIQENIETVVIKVDSTEASLIGKYKTFNKKLEELNTDLKDYIYKTKRELFSVTEKEAQIVRDRIEGPLPSLGNYIFDLYVNNFKTLVRSGKQVDSIPWHINELQTCVTGSVTMLTNGEMQVWLMYGRRPREVGLRPRSGKILTITATICDIDRKKLPPVDVDDRSCSPNKEGIPWNGSVGIKVGVRSCDVLLEKGYGVQGGYNKGTLLIRYEIKVR